MHTRVRNGSGGPAQGSDRRGSAGLGGIVGKQAGLALRPKWPAGLLSLPHISSSYPYII